MRVFRLRNADPSEVAEQLAQLFPDDTASGSARTRPGSASAGPHRPGTIQPGVAAADIRNPDGSERKQKLGRVLAVADARASSLVVSAASSLMPQIAALIERLDADPGRKEVDAFWDLRNADPQDVKQVLQDLFNRNITVQNNNDNNPLLGQNNR